MTVLVSSRADLTLAAVERVAWAGEDVRLGPEVAGRLEATHDAFGRYVRARLAEDPGALLYGVTTGPGDKGTQALGHADLDARPQELAIAESFGEPLPERVTRAIVLARLANLVDGHAAVRPIVADTVAGLLGGPSGRGGAAGGRLPPVPSRGNGGSGEILALGHLFAGVARGTDLTARERMALVNGSPCAAALTADAALVARRRLALAEQVLALSAEALRAPLDAYDPALGELWGDPHQTAALTSLTDLLEGGAPGRLAYQAPVSFRVLPRVLGRVREAVAHAEHVASASLAAVTDNPVFLPPADGRPLGAFVSNGGYHDDRAAPALDGLAHAWADLAQVAQRHVDQLLQHPQTAEALAREPSAKVRHMVAAGFAEEARTRAQTTVLGAHGFAQNDLASPAFGAWATTDAVGTCLDRALAVLASLAAVLVDPAPPGLRVLLGDVAGRPAAELATSFGRRVHTA